MVRRGIDGPGPQGWAGNWYFHQPDLEQRAARGRWRAFPMCGSISATRSHRSTNSMPATSSAATARARWCARRSAAGSTISACTSPGWSSTFCAIPPVPRVKALPDYTVQLCDPARPMTVVNVGGDRRRWEIMLMPGDDPARLTEPGIFWPMMARWLGPEDARLERAAVYTFHSVVQEGWRKGQPAAGRRCLPPDAALPRPGHVRRHARRRQPRLEARRRAARRRRPSRCSTPTRASARPHVRDLHRARGEARRHAAGDRSRQPPRRAIAASPPAQRCSTSRSRSSGPGCRADAPPPVGTIFPQPRLRRRPADGRGDRPALRHRRRRSGCSRPPRPMRCVLPGVGGIGCERH